MEQLNRYWIFGHLFSSVLAILMLAVVVSLLRSRRPPGSTLAWIFAVIVIPYVGIPLYFLFGIRKIRGVGRTRKAERPRILDNREVHVLSEGVQAYLSLVAEIERAKTTIDIATFIFARDDVAEQILHKLTAKARDGVRVRLLIDAWGSSFLVRPSFHEFKKVGGKVGYFKPLSHFRTLGQINLRNHRKLAILDDRVAILGGMNIAQEYMGPTPMENRWADLGVRIEGNSLAPLRELFQTDWNNARMGRPVGGQVSSERLTDKAHEHRAQIVASGPDNLNDPLYDQLLSACFDARERIWIATPYFVPDETLTKALNLAALRGVDVRLLVPGKSNHFFADLCRGSYIRQLRESGVQVFYYPQMSHAKLVLIDDSCALVGSANFDLRSLLYNYELGVFLYSESEIMQLKEWLSQHMARAKLYQGAKPGLIRETVEGLVRVFGPLF